MKSGWFIGFSLWASALTAQDITRVTADRVDGPAEERSAFFHDESGSEVFAFDMATPVTITVRLLDPGDWTDADIADASAQLVTCPEGDAGPAGQTVAGPVLTLQFDCVVHH